MTRYLCDECMSQREWPALLETPHQLADSPADCDDCCECADEREDDETATKDSIG